MFEPLLDRLRERIKKTAQRMDMPDVVKVGQWWNSRNKLSRSCGMPCVPET
jgi:hypothetical protein